MENLNIMGLISLGKLAESDPFQLFSILKWSIPEAVLTDHFFFKASRYAGFSFIHRS